MNGIDPFSDRQFDDRVDVQVGPNRIAGLTDQKSIIGLIPVDGQKVFVAIERYGPNTEFGTERNIRMAISPRFAASTF